MTFQQVIIIGNVGRDPEITYTKQGIPVCKFTVAVNKVTGKGETRQEKTTWFRVNVWRDRAEVASQYIKKGMKIMCIGEIEVSAYIDKNGAAAASIELTANDFKFLDSRGEGGAGGGEFQGQGSRGGNAAGRGAGGGSGEDFAAAEDVNDIPF